MVTQRKGKMTFEELDNLNDGLASANTQLEQIELESVITAPNKKAIMFAGVIRNSGSGWDFIEDEAHNNINFTSIAIVGNTIALYHPQIKLIGAMTVTPDEMLASYGLTCGASVGDTSSFISCYAPFKGYINGAGTVVINPWFDGEYTVTPLVDETGFNIEYDARENAGNDAAMATSIRDANPPHNGLDIRCARPTATSVQLRAYHDLYGYIAYSGGVWVVTSSCKANIVATFDTGVLTISHDSLSSNAGFFEFQSVVATIRKSLSGSLIHARVHSVAQSFIKIEFYDNTGTLIATPTTDMRLFFSRPGFRVPHTWNVDTKTFFDFGYAQINPVKLISANGNLWIMGIHQAL